MRSISAPLAAHLAGDVQTICTLWKVTRRDGQVFGFTDLDRDVTYSGLTYTSTGGYTHSQVETSSDLSTGNLELSAIFELSPVTKVDLEAGVWDYATVSISLVNYADLSMGEAVLASGVLGQVTLLNGQYRVEIRSLSQLMQQPSGELYGASCRATLGDSRCKVALGPLTASGTVDTVTDAYTWADPSLTQTGPTVDFADTTGRTIPTTAPYTIKVVPPTGGAFVANLSVKDAAGSAWTQVAGSPGSKQYSVAGDGTYTFNSGDATKQLFLSYSYSIGYFAYGKVTFTSGDNAGYSAEVKAFAPGFVTVALPFPFPVEPGDTYTISAGCDRTFGTCKNRFNNVVNFRGEPYVPGLDTILRPQSK
ncbi:DUF2163 domain-containing protein [Cupriavidus sp. KK10]|jgi:hypothetical protein|uniref:DUF2163 domain-containing protein n=1 Tax=Cupriavidus sp. KK10 TaxID=1478019 RepID=UPI001BA9F139|nr:DUF2163 domain-containing protein [Cupriavidus sp. KK10]QUN28702.1 DUF2163 domain-containing protein [Cupriavidus sp. KK10]